MRDQRTRKMDAAKTAIKAVLKNVLVSTHVGLLVFSAPAQADSGAGWFIGGVVTAKVVNNMERRTQAEEAQASRPAPQPARQAPAQPTKPSKESQLQELDNASGGYITPQEYKDRRKAILDSN